MRHIMKHTTLLAILLLALPVMAEDAPYAETITGDWGGARSNLADHGVDIGLNYTADIWSVASGGKKRRTTYLDLLELRADLDGEKLFGIKGNSMTIALINSAGTQPNASNVGSTQGIDNDEVGDNGLRLYEAWMNQEFFDGRLAVLVGLHDLNSEFVATPISDNFMKPVMQIGQSFAQSGRGGPSLFPVTSLAARLRVKPSDNSYVAAAIYDGMPGDADHSRSNPITFDDKNGALFVGEIGYVAPIAADPESEANKIALGYWSYTAKMDDQADTSLKKIPHGGYVLTSYQFYRDKNSRTLGGFFRAGMADGDTAQVDWDYTVGVVGNGWVAGRDSGEFGLGLAQAHNSDDYVTSVAGATDRNEYSYELYYRDTVYPGVSMQPDLQYVVNPGTDQVTDNALVLGLRADIAF